MEKIVSFVKNWTLPIAMTVGVLTYIFFHLTPMAVEIKEAVWKVDSVLTPTLIFLQLLLTFCKVEPRAFRFRRWHLWLLLIQLFGSTAAYLVLVPVSPLLAQGALVCLICPTATAAAVITGKLGGSAETLITYTMLVNFMAAIYVPIVFPLVYRSGDITFVEAFLRIVGRVFPLLILPFLLAQFLRRFAFRLHQWLRENSGMAFYIWALALAIVMGKTAKSIVDDSGDMQAVVSLALVSLAVCCFQFAVGKVIGGQYGDRISGGQAIGQKNTVLAIWMAFTYLNPVVTVAPGAYVLWQNIINSYQLWKRRKRA